MLVLLGSNEKLESGIVCVFFIAVFYAEYDVNGQILGYGCLALNVTAGAFCFWITILWRLLFCYCDHGNASSLCCFICALHWVSSSVYGVYIYIYI
jgi:hypothetical protein